VDSVVNLLYNIKIFAGTLAITIHIIWFTLLAVIQDSQLLVWNPPNKHELDINPKSPNNIKFIGNNNIINIYNIDAANIVIGNNDTLTNLNKKT